MKVYPILLSNEIIPLEPDKGFYIMVNGLKIYENEHKVEFDKARNVLFENIESIKEKYDKLWLREKK